MDKMINSPAAHPTGQGTSYLGWPTSSDLRPLHQGCPLLLCLFQVRIIEYSAMMSPLLFMNFCIYHHHQSTMRLSSSTAVYDRHHQDQCNGNFNFPQVSQFKFGGQIASWGSTQLRLRTKIGSRGPVRSAKIRLRGIFWTFGSCALTSTWFLMSATKLYALCLNC